MNIWERYPAKGTHGDAMKAKAKVKTYEYTCYNGIDRDDWSVGKVKALTKEDAINAINKKLWLTGMNLKRSSVKVIQNQ